MHTAFDITHAAFVSGKVRERESGLLGWITCVVNNTLLLDGIALRRTRDGRLTLAFPSRTDRAGQRHAYIRPVDDDARQHLEQEIFKAIRLRSEETAP